MMTFTQPKDGARLKLRAGEIVEVKAIKDILLTLDAEGKCAGLPFMPEMLIHCGKRYRVFKRADKTCDSIKGTWMIRRMYDTVLLDGIRCDGKDHGGCEAGCMVFWKEAWLRRVDAASMDGSDGARVTENAQVKNLVAIDDAGVCPNVIKRNAVKYEPSEGATEARRERYSCQATELHKCTEPLSPGDVRQYVRDIVTGNVGVGEFLRGIAVALFNLLQKRRRGCIYPHVEGKLTTTPKMVSNLQVGEMVRVKSLDQIAETLDVRNRNKGLLFDLEMANFCGGTYRVAKRVKQIVNEGTGEMMKLPNDCLILDGVSCQSQVHGDRLFCPRRIYSYWREAWLERVQPSEGHVEALRNS